MVREAWKKQRAEDIETSNNKRNPNQNVCAYNVAYYFNCHKQVKFLHRISDLLRAVRKRYQVRSRMSIAKKLLAKKKVQFTVAQLRKIIPEIVEIEDKSKNTFQEFYDPVDHRNWIQETHTVNDVQGFIVLVEGHVLALKRNGEVANDSDPRLRDRRKVNSFYMVNRTFDLTPSSKGWTDEIDADLVKEWGL